MKKIFLLGILILMTSITNASEISFSADHWDIQKWCLVATDVFINTDEHPVAATDIVIESSLEYVDFVPTKTFFPHYFPPNTGANTVHIIGFISDPKNTVMGSGSIGKIFFRQRSSSDTDGTMKLYFAGQGKTYDSNLSMLWWIDVLDTVGSGYYNFIDQWSCEYPANYNIVGWFSHMSAQEALKIINKELLQETNGSWLFNRKYIVGFLGWVILLTIVFIYMKRRNHEKQHATA